MTNLRPGTESDALLARITGPALTVREFALLAVACADQAGLSVRKQGALARQLHDCLPLSTDELDETQSWDDSRVNVRDQFPSDCPDRD